MELMIATSPALSANGAAISTPGFRSRSKRHIPDVRAMSACAPTLERTLLQWLGKTRAHMRRENEFALPLPAARRGEGARLRRENKFSLLAPGRGRVAAEGR